MTPWNLPEVAEICGTVYRLHTDYRDILEIFRQLDDPDNPEWLRWKIAVALFFEGEVPEDDFREASLYLADFLSGGNPEETAGSKLLDWEQDAAIIVADVNKVAGTEVRAVPHLHWWTFLAYFNAIGEGQLSMLVSLRDKLARGKKLEKWEQEYYRKHKSRVDLKKRYSSEEIAAQERLKALLDGR